MKRINAINVFLPIVKGLFVIKFFLLSNLAQLEQLSGIHC